MQESQSQVLVWRSYKKERYQRFPSSKLSEGEKESLQHIYVWRTGVRALASALGRGRWFWESQWQGNRRTLLWNIPMSVRFIAVERRDYKCGQILTLSMWEDWHLLSEIRSNWLLCPFLCVLCDCVFPFLFAPCLLTYSLWTLNKKAI